MADNRLRCALVYRLESGSGTQSGGISAVLLSKYDHASQLESHGGGGTALYGGRDKGYADAVAMVVQKDPPKSGPNGGGSGIGGPKVVTSDVHQVIYAADSDGICVAVIAGKKYPSRAAVQMLAELHGQFVGKFDINQMRSATVNSLSSKSKPIMSAACAKYDDPKNVDKASALISKVDEVKSSMQGNIATMLANTEKAEGLKETSDQLTEQATVFKKRSTDLKKEMRWKNVKVTILLVVLVVGILLAIIIPLILKAKKST